MRQVLLEGAIAGYPLADLRVVVYDGKHHPVDSKEVAFVSAGRKAFKDAVTKAAPDVLEPIARLAVTVPSPASATSRAIARRFAGESSARTRPGSAAPRARAVPLAELVEYAATLKSLTGGEGLYTARGRSLRRRAARCAEGARRGVSPASRRVARTRAGRRARSRRPGTPGAAQLQPRRRSALATGTTSVVIVVSRKRKS